MAGEQLDDKAMSKASDDLIQIRLAVLPQHDGWRMDHFIKARIPRLSRNRIQQMIRSQSDLGGAKLRPAMKVHSGQEVLLLRPAPDEPDVPRSFEVLHSDPLLMIIHKPAGLPIHATARFHRNTLVAVLRERFNEDVPHPAHRLDRETSGLMVLARTAMADTALKESFRRREVDKSYLAIVHGRPPQEGLIDLPLGPDVDSGIRVKMGVAFAGSPARTRYGVLSSRGDFSLVEAQPETGRQHQIRAHLGALGHPIVGDKLYGEDPRCLLEYLETGWTQSLERRLLLPRHALHAASIAFPHPSTGERVCFSSPLPADLQDFWDSLP